MKKNTTSVLASVLISVSVLFLILILPFMNLLELKTIDIRSKLYPVKKVDSKIIIVTIDDTSFDQINIRWPWPRQIIAQAINNISDAEAAVIGLDIMMGDGGYNAEEDVVLAASIKKSGKVVLPIKKDVINLNGYVVDYFDKPLPDFSLSAAAMGYVNLIKDRDGYVRRILMEDSSLEIEELPFSLRIIEEYYKNIRGKNRTLIPKSNNNTLIINYSESGKITKIPFYKIINGDFNKSILKDSIVLIGAYFKESHDLFFTPSEGFTTGTSGLYGVEIHGNIINTILTESYLQELPQHINMFIIIALIIVSSILFVRIKPTKGLIIFLFTSTVYIIISLFIYKNRGLIISLFLPIFSISLCFIGAIIFNYLIVEKEKRKVRSTFSRFVSQEVVNSLLETDNVIKLGGEIREVVIFFSDICGFTSLSERMSPQEIVEMLNIYFTQMTDIVFKYKGTVNKYIGDAIMAFYGAPVILENPSKQAVLACLQMRESLKLFNKQRESEGKETLKIGMGLHKGKVLVGNIGSPRQMEYTVIGDAVNVSSRIEGLTRHFNTDLLISDQVYNDVKDLVNVETQEPKEVKGKKDKIIVHKILGLKEKIS